MERVTTRIPGVIVLLTLTGCVPHTALDWFALGMNVSQNQKDEITPEQHAENQKQLEEVRKKMQEYDKRREERKKEEQKEKEDMENAMKEMQEEGKRLYTESKEWCERDLKKIAQEENDPPEQKRTWTPEEMKWKAAYEKVYANQRRE